MAATEDVTDDVEHLVTERGWSRDGATAYVHGPAAIAAATTKLQAERRALALMRLGERPEAIAGGIEAWWAKHSRYLTQHVEAARAGRPV